MTATPRKNIAIIGSGISGLGSAYLLHPHHNITVYEKNDYPGGHSRTRTVKTPDGKVAVDTGFIVFNYRNYPLLTGIFKHLGVPVAKSDMSFGASIENGWLEYGTQHVHNIFTQKSNLLKPQFWGMIFDLLRFNRQARAYIKKDVNITLGQCLDELKMGTWFREYFMLAMGAAIWSTPLLQMRDFPAKSFLTFFESHGLLTINDQPQWFTVVGGSREYVLRLTESFKDRIKYSCGATKITRLSDGVLVEDTLGGTQKFDEVIFACHGAEALAMIQNPSLEEQKILGAFRSQPNRMLLHSDPSFMPKRKGAWASWVYLSEKLKDDRPAISLTYWMNRLQPLKTKTPIFVTLNPAHEPKDVHDEHNFAHPLYDEAAIRAQAKMPDIQGKDRLWFCGAYLRYGFHEDGLHTAVDVARMLGGELPWK